MKNIASLLFFVVILSLNEHTSFVRSQYCIQYQPQFITGEQQSRNLVSLPAGIDVQELNLQDILGEEKLHIKQKVQDQYFKVTVPQGVINVIVELVINKDMTLKASYRDLPLLFMGSENKIPKVTYQDNSASIDAKIFDSNGAYGDKEYVYIRLPQDSGNEWYFLSHIAKGSIYEYDITAKFEKNKIPCPNKSCSGRGACISGKCLCFDEYIDEDCSVKADKLQNDVAKAITADPIKKNYLYYDTNVKQKQLTIQVKKFQSPKVIIYSNFGTVDSSRFSQVPNSKYHEAKTIITDNLTVLELPMDEMEIKGENDHFQAIFLVQSAEPTSALIEFTITKKSDKKSNNEVNSNMIIVYFLLAVAGILFIVWIVLTIIRIKYGQQQQQEAILGLGMGAARRRRNQQQFTLNKVTIEKYMPAKEFQQLKQEIKKKLEDEESCSVCLVEFESKDLVRKTICQHIFHTECLEEWLGKHENCPLCREELTKKKLDENYKLEHGVQVEEQEEGEDEEGGASQNNRQNQQAGQQAEEEGEGGANDGLVVPVGNGNAQQPNPVQNGNAQQPNPVQNGNIQQPNPVQNNANNNQNNNDNSQQANRGNSNQRNRTNNRFNLQPSNTNVVQIGAAGSSHGLMENHESEANQHNSPPQQQQQHELSQQSSVSRSESRNNRRIQRAQSNRSRVSQGSSDVQQFNLNGSNENASQNQSQIQQNSQVQNSSQVQQSHQSEPQQQQQQQEQVQNQNVDELINEIVQIDN